MTISCQPVTSVVKARRWYFPGLPSSCQGTDSVKYSAVECSVKESTAVQYSAVCIVKGVQCVLYKVCSVYCTPSRPVKSSDNKEDFGGDST